MVSELLRDSMAAHRQAQTFSRAQNKQGARDAWARAFRLRKQAIEADPQRTDPAWQAEQKETPFGRDSHDELLKFYVSQGIK